MLDEIDLADRHQVERLRRSVAMAGCGQMVLHREEALRLLEALIAHLEYGFSDQRRQKRRLNFA